MVNNDGTVNLYSGISACTVDLHVHVKCDQHFISQLFTLAEPELSGLRQERHAKTIEIAQKEVLTCIGLALFERFQRIQQKLKEGEQTCDLLFLTVLKTLRRSLDMAAEKKRGVGDLELLCQEIDREEKRKEEKREKKKNKKAKRKESKNCCSKNVAILTKLNGVEGGDGLASDGESNSGDSGVSSGDSHKGDNVDGEVVDCIKVEDKGCDKENVGVKENVCPRMKNKKGDSKKVLSVQISPTKPSCKAPVCKPSCKGWYQPRVGNKDKGISLEDMLEDDWEEDEGIPQEDIRMFLDMREDMIVRRQQLRENLKARFAQLCVTGLTTVN